MVNPIIKIEKGLNFLPYVSSNISGERLNYDDDINYSSPKYNYVIGFNFELNKNLLIEGTINPDFSQVEADATKIDVNSPTAINYPLPLSEEYPLYLGNKFHPMQRHSSFQKHLDYCKHP